MSATTTIEYKGIDTSKPMEIGKTYRITVQGPLRAAASDQIMDAIKAQLDKGAPAGHRFIIDLTRFQVLGVGGAVIDDWKGLSQYTAIRFPIMLTEV